MILIVFRNTPQNSLSQSGYLSYLRYDWPTGSHSVESSLLFYQKKFILPVTITILEIDIYQLHLLLPQKYMNLIIKKRIIKNTNLLTDTHIKVKNLKLFTWSKVYF